ncbi:MAG: PHP domain-containing protein [Bacteroidales bacterium]
MINEGYILKNFPPPDEILKVMESENLPHYLEVNGHIHTPFSFSAFNEMEEIFSKAREENIKILGVNDFYVTDGFSDFYRGCIKNGIFPVFCIEFIGLITDFQKNGIRVNDPNNPGRIYFSGKGLDYPFHLDSCYLEELNKVRGKTQEQLKKMVDRLNVLISKSYPSLTLKFEDIIKRYARELVRERHLARAVRMLAIENFHGSEEQLKFIKSLYGGKKSKSGIENPAAMENEIRSFLLKSGGAAFVEEDNESFLDPTEIIQIIKNAGGIPCYPVLLDDPSGKFTEFEKDYDKLYESLLNLDTYCIELIPGRNDYDVLQDFVRFFYDRGFVITFGTEHNTPAMEPLTVRARERKELSTFLKEVSWKGACVIAAHQYLRAKGMNGYELNDKPLIENRNDFEKLGQQVIEYYFKTKKNETGD